MNHQQQSQTISYPTFVQQVKLLTSSDQNMHYIDSMCTYPVEYTLDLIYDQTQTLDVRRMSCMILKMKMSNKQHCSQQQINPQMVLAKLQTLFMINSKNNSQLFKLQNSIELVIEKIFQVYFDDGQKITFFQQITQNLIKQPLCKQIKHLVFLEMLLKQMNYLSVNSQQLIGQMVLFLGDFLKIVEQKMTNIETFTKIKDEVYEVLSSTIELMKEIKNIVDENQQQQNVVGEFMMNSKQIKTHLFGLLKLQIPAQIKKQQPVKVICTTDRKLNKVKAMVLQLWHDVWLYHVEPNMLELLLATLLTTPKPLIIDQTQSIITSTLSLLERSCCHRDYNQIFFKLTQGLTIKLFELIAVTESQFSLLQTDIDYFIEIADDFCKQQEMQTMKTRAGSLLSNLTLSIDGYLTFVTHMAMVSIRQLLANYEQEPAQVKIWQGLINAWACSKEQLIETSILVLSALSDQIQKRKDLLIPIKQLLVILTPYLTQQSALGKNTLLMMRFMQMYSFYSFPSCFDSFLRHFSAEPCYQKQLSNSFETMMKYYDKKNPQMEQYVKDIANSIMLLGNQLTPLLEQEIMKNNRVIQHFKEKVLEKLVLWFMYSYEKQQVLKINKLSTLIVRLLIDNMKSEILPDQKLQPFSKEILNSYLEKVYKLLSCTHPCQQSIIQIAISHLEYLFDMEQVDMMSCENFYQMAKTVIQRNNYSLNDCLILLNTLVCPDVKMNRKGKWETWKFDQLTLAASIKILSDSVGWLNTIWEKGNTIKEFQEQTQKQFILREQDVWEILQLIEICLFQVEANHSLMAKLSQIQINGLKNSYSSILSFSLKVTDQCKSKTLKCKLISIMLQIVQMFPQNTQNYGFLPNIKYLHPCDFPADQCRKYLYCLTKIMHNYMVHFSPDLRVRVIRVMIDLVYFLQNQKAHMKEYDQLQFVNGDGVSLNAMQKKTKTYSAFDFRLDFQPHEDFKRLIQKYPVKDELKFLDQEQGYQGKIRDLADKIVVNEKTRKRVIIKRNL